ncbi:hypothetical protein JNJ66_07790 [Candidatus Saccharibacteria bacterium]|nr:hypothetical protein [Candidatus Saccharibacteria bacterium]
MQRIVFDSWYIPLLVLGMLGLFISVWLGSRLTKKYSQLPAFIVCLVVGLVCLGFVGWRIVEVISSVGADNDRARTELTEATHDIFHTKIVDMLVDLDSDPQRAVVEVDSEGGFPGMTVQAVRKPGGPWEVSCTTSDGRQVNLTQADPLTLVPLNIGTCPAPGTVNPPLPQQASGWWPW